MVTVRSEQPADIAAVRTINEAAFDQPIEAGLGILRAGTCPFVIVLGHPEYYPRFGFVPASRHGLACPWEGVPDEVFMALIIDDDEMAGVEGVVRYRPEFDEAT